MEKATVENETFDHKIKPFKQESLLAQIFGNIHKMVISFYFLIRS